MVPLPTVASHQITRILQGYRKVWHKSLFFFLPPSLLTTTYSLYQLTHRCFGPRVLSCQRNLQNEEVPRESKLALELLSYVGLSWYGMVVSICPAGTHLGIHVSPRQLRLCLLCCMSPRSRMLISSSRMAPPNTPGEAVHWRMGRLRG